MTTDTAADSKIKPGKLDRQIQARIGQQLRSMYDDVVEEGVPDRFAELLKKLDSAASGDVSAKEQDKK